MSHIGLRNLSIHYGSHKVLEDINVDIPDGKITAIIGPSGCGKTTLLKSINRLLEINDGVRISGNVMIDGMNIYDPRSDVLALRKKVGFLSQRPFPLPMSIYDNIAFGPKVHRSTKEQIRRQVSGLERHLFDADSGNAGGHFEIRGKCTDMDVLVEGYLRMASLWEEVKDRLHAPASKLSIGQQQRLALARALAVEPEVILADEPTSALDPISAQLIEKQFQHLKKTYTIIVVTHILRQARRIADHVLFLYLGELVEHAPAESFFVSPQDKRTKAYISGEIS
jgi:phosphate transport system ATP-binding protein